MSKAVRVLSGSWVGLLAFSRVGAAQQSSSYQLNGPEMVFLLLLVAFVIGGWVGYEWIRKGRAS